MVGLADESWQAIALAMAFVVLHLFLSAREIGSCVTWLFTPSEEDPWAQRLETAMVESRKANIFQFARYGSFAGAGGLTYFIYAYYTNPRMSEASFALATLVMYVQYTAISTRALELTIGRAQFSCCLFYGLCCLCYLELPFIEQVHMDAQAFNVTLVAIRFILAAVAIDTRLSVPWQLLLSAGQLWADFSGPNGVRHPAFTVFLQGVVLGLTIFGSYTLETCVQSNIRAQFHRSDAESLMVSFRRMLRGICDGEVLLDSNLRIHSASDCLKHLLMTSTNMHGKSFQQLLDPRDLQKFRKFMETSASTAAESTSSPSCMRVSLLGAASTRISVDVFHVPISKLYGSHDPYHLIALKEDGEHREPPANNHPQVEIRPQLPPRRASSEASAGAAMGLQGLFNEIVEMSLLVDPSTAFCDVRQVNLRFRRGPGERGPSLRSTVLPTDWASIKDAVTQFAQKEETGHVMLPTRLPAIRCRMMDQSSRKYNLARLAELSSYRGTSGRLWLRLGDLVEGNESREYPNLQPSGMPIRRLRRAQMSHSPFSMQG
ncbi:Mcat [Symbiodinium natans]|uniref:Mcat protein n=1 Tax=Symbiodinium natans TaxID=878477 RepID=A0A812MUN3_9DINO|nr:Mcat [Symbiodinium natans]